MEVTNLLWRGLNTNFNGITDYNPVTYYEDDEF